MDLWMIVAALCAYLVKGMCGFANTLVFSTILSFHTSNIQISPLELILGYPSNIVIAWRERKALSARIYVPVSVMVIAGSIPGVYLLKNGNVQWIKLLFGIVVTGLGIEMLVREHRKKKRKTSPGKLAVIGILSGLLCGLFGIGALLAAYISRTTEDNSSFRGNLCVVFLVENTFRIILYGVTGILTKNLMIQALSLFPVMLTGLISGLWLSHQTGEKLIKKISIFFLILSGLSLTINQLFQ
ncbi:MAG: sulfite exporter TauE/SafE family protein [Clostridiales bacterium]|nr:sulfite exporter TauE/SafE family protein [Clostridiales bacterium]